MSGGGPICGLTSGSSRLPLTVFRRKPANVESGNGAARRDRIHADHRDPCYHKDAGRQYIHLLSSMRYIMHVIMSQ